MECSSVVSACSLNNMRPIAVRHPDFWGDRFINHTFPQDTKLEMEQEVEKLKDEVRKKLMNMKVANDPKTIMFYVDEVERLGVAYHFEEEIEDILLHLYSQNHTNDNDLNYISLHFRILRQHGFYISCDVFEKFKGENGSFKESLAIELNGILNLYEASYLRVHGETILDEAMEFTKSQLKLLVEKLSEPKATRVHQALKMPLHRSLPRLTSRNYIDTYETNPFHDKTLLRFAKLDFNLLQLLHLKELRDLSRWWKSHDFSTTLPFVRDRIVETYLWASGSYEPQYALLRTMCAKSCITTAITDDIFDAYGLYDELVLYMEAIQSECGSISKSLNACWKLKWDRNCTNQLPHYMKVAYGKLLDTFDGFEQDLATDGRSHNVSYARELMKDLCRGYFQEAKWVNEKYIPTYDEYMECAGISTGTLPFSSSVAFMGMGKVATKEAFEWVSHTPKPVRAVSMIGRLINDIASHKAEQSRGDVASSVECIMLQYGISEEKAVKEVYKKAEEKWKDLNEEMLRPTKVPRPLLTAILNLHRGSEFLYGNGDDEYSVVNQNMLDKVHTILLDPIAV